jgi:hypothetical protein
LNPSYSFSRHMPYLQPRLASRPVIVCLANRGDPEHPQRIPSPRNIADTAVKISGIGVAASVLAQPAGAWGYTWRPRRHHRRMDEWQREPDLGKYSQV